METDGLSSNIAFLLELSLQAGVADTSGVLNARHLLPRADRIYSQAVC